MSDQIANLPTDLFNNPNIDMQELCRRLSLFANALNLQLKQIKGDETQNDKIVTYGDTSSSSGLTITRVGFDVAGATVELVFKNGKLVP